MGCVINDELDYETGGLHSTPALEDYIQLLKEGEVAQILLCQIVLFQVSLKYSPTWLEYLARTAVTACWVIKTHADSYLEVCFMTWSQRKMYRCKYTCFGWNHTISLNGLFLNSKMEIT